MLPIATAVEQVATHLRGEINTGRWGTLLPGRKKLVKELGVNGNTIERAIQQLEKEGVLKSQGPGKRRLIVKKKTRASPKTRIAIIVYEPKDQIDPIILDLRHHLNAAGHSSHFAPKSLTELKQDPDRVETMIQEIKAKACIILAGARPVLERFAEMPIPTFSFFGQRFGLPVAGVGAYKVPAMQECIQCLYEAGHRRIVMMPRANVETPNLTPTELSFLEELKKRDLSHGSYNLPEWDLSPQGFHDCLRKLFQVTPPSAILVDDWILFYSLQSFLMSEERSHLGKVTCISTDYHPSFTWWQPGVAHFRWDTSAAVKRAVQWAQNVANGKDDRKQSLVNAKFIVGGANISI
jgi:DNA-binding LacI/PurR family transcriptional regulator